MFEKGLGYVDGLRVGMRASVRALGYISHSLFPSVIFEKQGWMHGYPIRVPVVQ